MSHSFETGGNGCAIGEFSVDVTGEWITPPAGTRDVEVYADAAVQYSRTPGGTGKFAPIAATTWSTVTGCPDGFWLKSATGTATGEMDALGRGAVAGE